MTRAVKFGISLVAIALVAWAGWTAWDKTRTWFIAKDVPISLSKGSHYVTHPVTTNMAALYSIVIDADWDRGHGARDSEAARELACRIGVNDPKHQPCARPPVWEFRWFLSDSNGTTVQGDSDQTIGQGWITEAGSVDREIGTFRTQAGQDYKFDLEVLFDNRDPKITSPRMSVAVADFHTVSSLTLGALLGIICLLLAATGTLVTLGSMLAQFLKRKRGRAVSS